MLHSEWEACETRSIMPPGRVRCSIVLLLLRSYFGGPSVFNTRTSRIRHKSPRADNYAKKRRLQDDGVWCPRGKGTFPDRTKYDKVIVRRLTIRSAAHTPPSRVKLISIYARLPRPRPFYVFTFCTPIFFYAQTHTHNETMVFAYKTHRDHHHPPHGSVPCTGWFEIGEKSWRNDV